MAVIPIAEPGPAHSPPGLALFELGFRPFFLLAGLTASVLMGLWMWIYGGGKPVVGYYPPMLWHGHEMLFGYTVAVVAGFLLTAVRNWTQQKTPGGTALAGLVMLWLLGRIGPFVSEWIPGPWIAVIDLSFLPVLAVILTLPLLRRRQRRNLVFVLLLAALTLCNLAIHLHILGVQTALDARQVLTTGIYLIVLMIMVMGGRVIPFFTEKAVRDRHIRIRPWLDQASLAATFLFVVLEPLLPGPAALAAVLAAVLHGARLYEWYGHDIWQHPLVWVLQMGYAWIVAGLLLSAYAVFDGVSPSLALHAFTAGGIGLITLGMMARVSLGHTGRELRTNPWIHAAFVLLALAVPVRVLLGWWLPQWYLVWVLMAGGLWLLAFLLFLKVYLPVLAGPSQR